VQIPNLHCLYGVFGCVSLAFSHETFNRIFHCSSKCLTVSEKSIHTIPVFHSDILHYVTYSSPSTSIVTTIKHFYLNLQEKPQKNSQLSFSQATEYTMKQGTGLKRNTFLISKYVKEIWPGHHKFILNMIIKTMSATAAV
jgi:hypothetical protein